MMERKREQQYWGGWRQSGFEPRLDGGESSKKNSVFLQGFFFFTEGISKKNYQCTAEMWDKKECGEGLNCHSIFQTKKIYHLLNRVTIVLTSEKIAMAIGQESICSLSIKQHIVLVMSHSIIIQVFFLHSPTQSCKQKEEIEGWTEKGAGQSVSFGRFHSSLGGLFLVILNLPSIKATFIPERGKRPRR